METLRGFGVEISASGRIAVDAEARLDLSRPFQPLRGLMGVVCWALAERERNGWIEPHCGGSGDTPERRTAARLQSCE